MKWLLSFVATSAVCVGSWCWADTVYLQDGTTVEGKVTSIDGAPQIVIDTPMGSREFRASMVEKIVKGAAPAASPSSQPTGQIGQPGQIGSPGPVAPAVPSNVDPASRERFVEAMKNADKAASGVEGLAVWDAFLKEVPTGPLADQAKTHQAAWKIKADKNLVRFGPREWLEKDKVDARVAKANELVGKADSASDPNEAASLLTQAAAEHPYRIDIPFKKAMIFHKAGQMVKFGQALGEVVHIEENNVVARNDLGVIAALNKQWEAAVANLLKASVYAENDIPFDNLDQAGALAEADGVPADTIASYDRQLRSIMDKLHHAKKHEGEQRWGNSWIKQDQYDKYVKDNCDIDKKIAADKRQGESDQRQYLACQRDINTYNTYVAMNPPINTPGYAGTVTSTMPTIPIQLQTAYTNAQTNMPLLKTDAQKLQADIDSLKAKKTIPPHSDKLVLLNPEGGELESKPAKAEPKTDVLSK